MRQYGSYRTTQEVATRGFTSTYLAERAAAGGDGPAVAVVKALDFTREGVEPDNPEGLIVEFLDSGRAQQRAGRASPYFARVYQTGLVPDGAYIVSESCPRSVQRLLDMHARIGPKQLFAVVTQIVQGLDHLRRFSERPHGNLKPSNVLLRGRRLGAMHSVALSDLLPAAQLSSNHPAEDLEAVGRMLFQLVTRTDATGHLVWPVDDSPDWPDMGRAGRRLRTLCNALLDPDAEPEAKFDRVAQLLAARRRARAAVRTAAAAIAIALIAVPAALYVRRHPISLATLGLRPRTMPAQPLGTQRSSSTRPDHGSVGAGGSAAEAADSAGEGIDRSPRRDHRAIEIARATPDRRALADGILQYSAREPARTSPSNSVTVATTAPVTGPSTRVVAATTAPATGPATRQIVAATQRESNEPSIFASLLAFGSASIKAASSVKWSTPSATTSTTANNRTAIATTSPATQGGGAATTQLAVLTTAPSRHAPEVVAGQAYAQFVGAPAEFRIAATNGPLEYDVIDLPAGLTLDRTLGIVRGKVTRSVQRAVRARARNAGGWGSYEVIDLRFSIDPRDRKAAAKLLADACESIERLRTSQQNLADARERLAGNQRDGDTQGVAIWEKLIGRLDRTEKQELDKLAEIAASLSELPDEAKESARAAYAVDHRDKADEVQWLTSNLTALSGTESVKQTVMKHLGP